MGLALQTGILAALQNSDHTLFRQYETELAATSTHLRQSGVAHEFQEPVQLPTDRRWSTDMYGYSGLHYLRRLAAYITLEKEMPRPGDWQSSSDPVL
ncbi:MAG: hypothetical protein AAGK47_08570 [Bacteroidota bacterium]